MADYKKMYAILCGAIDDVLDDLDKIPLALPSAKRLQKGLLDAEEVYIETEETALSLQSNSHLSFEDNYMTLKTVEITTKTMAKKIGK